MPSGNYTQKITHATTSTGATSYVDWADAMGNVTAQHIIAGTTKAYTFTLQGSVGQSAIWANLTAATTGSTGGATVSSTVGMTFDKVRISFSANDSTGNGTFTAYLNARP